MRDKSYKEIELLDIVQVPEPRSFNDNWHYEFIGTVIKFIEDDYCIVEDMDGDCFTIESELLEVYEG